MVMDGIGLGGKRVEQHNPCTGSAGLRSVPEAAEERDSAPAYESRVLESVFRGSQSCLALLDPAFRYIRVNDRWADRHRSCAEEFTGRSFFADYPSDDLRDVFYQVAREGEPWHTDDRPLEFGDDDDPRATYCDLSVVPIVDARDRVTSLLVTLQDVTENTRTEQEKRAIIDVLQLVNLTHDLHDLGDALIAHVREWTGCEAAALRLRQGEDFPFFATAGFPEELLEAENELCAFDENGEILRDREGRPVLECMCGCVLCQTIGGRKPYFTEHGSFCVASSTQFLIEYEDSLPDRLRGKCVEQGYESIAIIPLRLNGEPFGLLHLCDHRRGLFDESTMTVLERLADNLAVALAHSRAQQDLMRHQRSLRALASRLAMTEEQERQRIATVLHDDLCQTLAFTRMKLGPLRAMDLPEAARDVTSEIDELLSEAIEFTRGLTLELSPPVLQQSGLAAALGWLTERVASRHGLSAECECHEDCFTSAEIDTIVFRSVRELLTNVVKHAEATTVRVWMECTEGAARIGVSDDGVGLDMDHARAAEGSGGFGLFSIREALAHIGGHLEVHSSPGEGTTCVLNVPLNAHESPGGVTAGD